MILLVREWKIVQKTKSNTDHHLGSIFGRLLDHFWRQNRFKIGSKAVLEAFPTPKWPPKAVWTPLGTVLGAFWEHFSPIFSKFWTKFWSFFRSKRCIYESISTLRLYLSSSPHLPPCVNTLLWNSWRLPQQNNQKLHLPWDHSRPRARCGRLP